MSTPATNPLTYNLYIQQMGVMAVEQTVETAGVWAFVNNAPNLIVPQMLNYAELRIQRDLDLSNSAIVRTKSVLPAGANTVDVSVNDFQVIDTVSYTSGSAKIPLLPVSKSYIQNVYNDGSFTGPPVCFASYGGDLSQGSNVSNLLLFGPWSDQQYTLYITGTQILPSLYVSSSTDGSGTTYISTNYPDILIQASMVYISQYQRNFLPTSNDPQMPGSFEAQYQTLIKSAIELENRKKFRDAVWSSQSQSPVATPTR